MAVIISAKGATNLSTTNGFYRCEAYNIGGAVVSTGLTLTTTMTTIGGSTITFANAGNCMGFLVYYASSNNLSYASSHAMSIALQEIKGTFTVTIASPGIITNAGHGLVNGDVVSFTTTGALPGGLVSWTPYYVVNATTNTFSVSLTAGGAAINTTGSQSGTHTLAVNRASKTLTNTQMYSLPSNPQGTGQTRYNEGDFIIARDWDTPYAVDTIAGKWRLVAWASATASGLMFIKRSTATAGSELYALWCNNQVTFTDNDCVICRDTVTVDRTATMRGVKSLGLTTMSVACITCTPASNPGFSNPQLKWADTPASSYTLTFDGKLCHAGYATFAIGSPSQPIPYAQRAIVDFSVSTVVASESMLTTPIGQSSNGHGRGYLFWYGAVPAEVTRTTLNGDVANSATSFTTTDATGWVAGDLIGIGRAPQGGGYRATYTVTSSSGTTVNISGTISGARKTGGAVIKLNGKSGILLKMSSWTPINYNFADIQMKGVEIPMPTSGAPTLFTSGLANMVNINTANNRAVDPALYTSTFFEDCSFYCTGANSAACPLQISIVPQSSFRVERCYFHNIHPPVPSPTWINATYYRSGLLTIKNNVILNWNNGSSGIFGSFVPAQSNALLCIQDNVFESANHTVWHLSGLGLIHTNNSYYGCNDATYGVITYQSTVNPGAIGGNKYNNNAIAISHNAGVVTTTLATNEVFGDTTANTKDIAIRGSTLHDFEYSNTTGLSTFDLTELASSYEGTKIRFTNYNGTTNNDWIQHVYGVTQRTGTGLTDTTVHTAGGYGIRFSPNSSTYPLKWTFNVPTGNIQGKTMTVSVWCKINTATYYVGVHQKPRLTVNYDNGTNLSYDAIAGTAWQLLAVSFIPSTTFGQITITLSGATDATGTDSYFYFDDFSLMYPPSVSLDLGALDNWANALPVTPPIALPLSAGTIAQGVWQQMTTANYGTGSMGELTKTNLDIPISAARNAAL